MRKGSKRFFYVKKQVNPSLQTSSFKFFKIDHNILVVCYIFRWHTVRSPLQPKVVYNRRLSTTEGCPALQYFFYLSIFLILEIRAPISLSS